MHLEGNYVSLQQWPDQLGGFQTAGGYESEGKQPLGKESPDDPLTGDREALRRTLRLALEVCIIQAEYGYSDEETALQIQENPYLQYFCGYPGYDDEKLPLIMGKAMKQQYEIFMVMCLLDNVSTRLL